MNKIRAAFLAFLLIVLVGCIYVLADGPTPRSASIARQDTGLAKINNTPIDLTGTWVSDGPPKITAKISGETMEIVMASGDQAMDYWHGSFHNPSGNNAGFTSTASSDKIFLSSASEKEFVYRDNTISFNLTMGAVTSIITMHRA